MLLLKGTRARFFCCSLHGPFFSRCSLGEKLTARNVNLVTTTRNKRSESQFTHLFVVSDISLVISFCPPKWQSTQKMGNTDPDVLFVGVPNKPFHLSESTISATHSAQWHMRSIDNCKSTEHAHCPDKKNNFSLERLIKQNKYGSPTASFESVHYIGTRVNLKTISKGIPLDKFIESLVAWQRVHAMREKEKQFRLPYKTTMPAESPEETWKHTQATRLCTFHSKPIKTNKQTNKSSQPNKTRNNLKGKLNTPLPESLGT